jgi:hypothetical protein
MRWRRSKAVLKALETDGRVNHNRVHDVKTLTTLLACIIAFATTTNEKDLITSCFSK